MTRFFFSVHKTITLQIKKRIKNQRMSSEQEIQAFFSVLNAFFL